MLYNTLGQKRIRIAYKAHCLADLYISYKESVLWCLSEFVSHKDLSNLVSYILVQKYNVIYIKPSRVSLPSLRRQHDFCMIYIHFSLLFLLENRKGNPLSVS